MKLFSFDQLARRAFILLLTALLVDCSTAESPKLIVSCAAHLAVVKKNVHYGQLNLETTSAFLEMETFRDQLVSGKWLLTDQKGLIITNKEANELIAKISSLDDVENLGTNISGPGEYAVGSVLEGVHKSSMFLEQKEAWKKSFFSSFEAQAREDVYNQSHTGKIQKGVNRLNLREKSGEQSFEIVDTESGQSIGKYRRKTLRLRKKTIELLLDPDRTLIDSALRTELDLDLAHANIRFNDRIEIYLKNLLSAEGRKSNEYLYSRNQIVVHELSTKTSSGEENYVQVIHSSLQKSFDDPSVSSDTTPQLSFPLDMLPMAQ